MNILKSTLTAALLGAATCGYAVPVYLNSANITVSLGSSMSADPFENLNTAASLANVIDAPTADASENHTSPTTHVWVRGGPLELVFDFKTEYDLSSLHFWNYYGEDFDVDNIDFKFYDSSMNLVGSLLGVSPALGGGGGNPIFAESYALAFPSNVQYVNALLSGSNDEVDFNNIGFTAELSTPRDPTAGVPDAASTALLVAASLAGLGLSRRKLSANA